MIAGVGLDVVEVERIRRTLARFGARFLDRTLLPAERRTAAALADPTPHVAGRFAAKEAALKALGTGLSRGIRWVDVEVAVDAAGAPRLRFHGAALDRAEDLGAQRAHLSITHAAGVAAAVVILERA
ncbi:MAG: holo-ACP synthase [Candidatus Eisenbacteria bacterium]